MNVKLFLFDFAFLLFFVTQGRETHNSDDSALIILTPFLISIISIIPFFYKIGFLTINEDAEYVKSLRIWMAIIVTGTLIRFVLKSKFETLFLLVIIIYSLGMSGLSRVVHNQFSS